MPHWLSQILFSSFYRVRGYRTVRSAFPVVALTALFVGLAAVTSSTGSYITIQTESSTITEGEEVIIEVLAHASVPVNAVDIIVDYPENQMKFSGIDVGESVITLWTEDPHEKGGKVYLRGGVFQKGFIGEHLIGKIRLRATQSGIAYVNLDSASFVAGDGKGTLVSVERVADNTTRLYVTPVDGTLTGEAEISVVTDVDGNGQVDLSDISTFMAAWFSGSKTFDFNNDGRMTFKDFSILLADSFFK